MSDILTVFKCYWTYLFYKDLWPLGKYSAPSSSPTTKIDLKKGLYGIYPDLRLRIHAISPKSVNKAAFPYFFLMLYLIQSVFCLIPFPAHSSCKNISVALDAGFYYQISSTRLEEVKLTSKSFYSKYFFLALATLAESNLPSISILDFLGYFYTMCSNHFFSSANIFLNSQPSLSYFSACKKYLPSVHNNAYYWEIIAKAFDPVNPDKNDTRSSQAHKY